MLRRWLEHAGYDGHARRQRHRHRRQDPGQGGRGGRPWWALAYANERALHARLRGARLPPADVRAARDRPHPGDARADRAADRPSGHAYAAADGSGDVYFDVRSWPSYGELSNQRIDDMEPAERRRPARQARPARLRAVEGPQGRASRRPRRGRRRGVAAGRAGTWSARRWPASTSATSSTSTAAASTCASRTTRTSWPSRRAAGRRFARFWMHNAMVNLGRREDEQVGRQLAARHRGREAGPADRAALLPGSRRTTARSSSSPRRRSPRRRPPSAGSRASSSGPPSWSATSTRRGRRAAGVRRGDGRRPRHAGGARRAAGLVRDGNKLLARRRRRTRVRANLASVRGDARRPRPRPAVGRLGVASGLERGSCDGRGRRAGGGAARAAGGGARRARTSPPPTRSATSSRAVSRSRTPRRARAGRCGDLMCRATASDRARASGARARATPTADPGGRRRRGLEGKGPTPKATRPRRTTRPTRRRRRRTRTRPAVRGPVARTGRSQVPERRSGSPGATPWSRRCRPASRSPTLYVAERTERDDRLREAFKLAAEQRLVAARGHPPRARPADRRCGAPGPAR